MAPKAVRDVHPETFIKAYAAHLKANDKVGSIIWHIETMRNDRNWQEGTKGHDDP